MGRNSSSNRRDQCAIALLLGGWCLFGSAASAAPKRLHCPLSADQADGAAASRTLDIIFDEQEKSLAVEEGGRLQTYKNVTISTVSINGASADATIGIDRSSWAIVYQIYRPDGVSSLLGSCEPIDQSNH